MRKIVFVSFILFILASSIYAGEFYNCIDRDGKTILTNSPQDGMKKCVLKESYKDPTPQERAKEQREIETYRQRMRTGIERNRAEAEQKSEALRAQQQEQQKQREAKKKEPSCYLTKERCTVSGGIVSGGTVSGGSEYCHATEVCTDEYGHETRKRVKTR